MLPRTLLFCASLSCLSAFSRADESFPRMLDEILRHPGEYYQICDVTFWPREAPIPAFRPLLQGEAGLSDKNVALLKKNRADFIPAIADKLREFDPLRKAQRQAPDPSAKKGEIDVDPIGVDPAVYSTVLLRVIEELNAREVFPELIAFETKFLAALEKAEKDAAAPVPTADGALGSGVVAEPTAKERKDAEKSADREPTPEENAVAERKSAIFAARMAHRDMLAAMVHIMRKVGYEPMLKSDLEKAYGAALKRRWAKDETYSKYKSRDSIPEEERESVKWDPIHQLAYPAWQPAPIPYSKKTRASVIELAKRFAAEKKAEP